MTGIKKDVLEIILGKAEIDPSVRPENVSMEEWGRIVDQIMEHIEDSKKITKGLKFWD